ncbi:MAG: hypothetical protein Q8M11_06370 [Sulfuritalea sp.]|nr:hypothetical protein [Sulfuritalea sp.]MDP1982119.1 hypothetical protein [Sulfuritalea sp.]
MSLTYCSRIVADTRVLGVHGAPGIGVYRLRFSIEFSIPNWSDVSEKVTVSNLWADVFAGIVSGELKFLGQAGPESPLFLEPNKYAQKSSLLFQLDLSESQIFALETLRNGGGLRFKFILMGYADGNLDRIAVRDELQCDVTLSDWARVLKEIGYCDVLIIGLELPGNHIGNALVPARDLVTKAHADLIAGRYDDVVARCRKALDSVQTVLNEKDTTNLAVERFNKGPRRLMTKLERELLVVEAVRHYSHLAHHVDEDGDPEWYSRSDATFLLAMAVAVLGNAGTRAAARAEAPPITPDQ